VEDNRQKQGRNTRLGIVAQGRAGLRSSTPTCCNTASEWERSRLVQEEKGASVE